MELLGTRTFKPEFDYTEFELQALKVMEEASELFQAARNLKKTDPMFNTPDERMRELEMEAADVLQADLNFLAMLGFDERDVRDLMMDCCRKNELRGRYRQ